MHRFCNYSRIVLIVAGIALLLSSAVVLARATYTKSPAAADRDRVWSTRTIEISATGEGAIPSVSEEPNRAKAYLQAKEYAKMQAMANLVQSIRGTLIKSTAVGHDYKAEERITQEINGYLDNVIVIDEYRRQEGNDTIVEVTVQTSIPKDKSRNMELNNIHTSLQPHYSRTDNK